MERQPLYVFKNENETGLDKVPPGSIVGVLCNGSIYQLKNKTGITSATKPKDVKNINLFVYDLATGRVEDSCLPSPTNPILGKINLYIMPCSYWDHWFTEHDGSSVNTSPSYPGKYRIVGTNKYALPTDVLHVIAFDSNGIPNDPNWINNDTNEINWWIWEHLNGANFNDIYCNTSYTPPI